MNIDCAVLRSLLESFLSPGKIVNFTCLYDFIYQIEGTRVNLLYEKFPALKELFYRVV